MERPDVFTVIIVIQQLSINSKKTPNPDAHESLNGSLAALPSLNRDFADKIKERQSAFLEGTEVPQYVIVQQRQSINTYRASAAAADPCTLSVFNVGVCDKRTIRCPNKHQ